MKKVTIFSLLLLLLFLVNWRLASAAPASDETCSEMRSEQVRLGLLASNIANVNTTRTPEGGPYKPFEKIACVNGGCKFVRGKSTLYKYEPGHPDAGLNGYVAYPNINIESTQSAFDLAATKLKVIASQKKCGTRILVNKDSVGRESSFMIHYLETPSEAKVSSLGQVIKEDIFNLYKGRVISWARTDAKGEMTTLNLKR